MPFPVLAQVLRSLGQAYVAAVAPLDPVQDFIHAGPPGEAAELSGQELLQGLALALCALLKGGVDVVGKVANEQIRHAYIMQASAVAEQVTAASRHNPGGAPGEQTRSCRTVASANKLRHFRRFAARPKGRAISGRGWRSKTPLAARGRRWPARVSGVRLDGYSRMRSDRAL
jgi:hypothetical protein